MSATSPRGLSAALRRPTGALSATIVAALVALAVIGPAVFGHRAAHNDLAHILQPGSAGHPFGTDELGRDILARILVATRFSLTLALLATLVAAGLGIPWGALPAARGRPPTCSR